MNDNSKFRWDNKEALEEQSMSPLELLRKYTILKRPVEIRGSNVYFREISFPRDCRTNLKINKAITVDGPEFYTLGCLHSFLKHRHDDHPEYVRKCISEDIKCVRRTDRDNVEQYLTGAKDFVLNLENMSHRQLNPELFGDQTQPGTEEYGGSYDGEYGGGSECHPAVEGKSKAERLLEQWKDKNLERLKASDRDKHSSDGERRNSGGRDSRSSEKDRGIARSRSRERRRRSRTRSGEGRRRSRSRSGGRSDRYDPFEPTLSPTKPVAPPPPAFSRPGENRFQHPQGWSSFDQHQGQDQGGMSTFGKQEASQRFGISPFDQRQQAQGGGGVSPFDQRPRSQRAAGESPFDQRQSRPDVNRFDQNSNDFDRPERSVTSRFDNSLNRLDEGNQIGFGNQQERKSRFDQEPQVLIQNQVRFGQEMSMRDQSRFDVGPRGNHPEEQRLTQSRFDQNEFRSNQPCFDQGGNQTRFDQEGPRGNQSRFDQEHQTSMMSQDRFGVNAHSQDLNTGAVAYSEYGESNTGTDRNYGQTMRGGRSTMGENMRNQMNDDGMENRDGRQGGSYSRFNNSGPAGGRIGASSSLGPMFTIGSQGGQGNSAVNTEARRW